MYIKKRNVQSYVRATRIIMGRCGVGSEKYNRLAHELFALANFFPSGWVELTLAEREAVRKCSA